MEEGWKARFKNEIMKIGSMNFREKREYIWEYYKIHIFITLCVAAFCGNIINTTWINPPKTEYLHIAWMSVPELTEHLDALADHLTEALVNDLDRETVVVSNYVETGDVQYDTALSNRFVAMLVAAQLDVIITDEEGVRTIAGFGYIQTLDGLLEELSALDAPLNERLQAVALRAEGKPDDDDIGQVGVYGLPVEDCNLFKALDIIPQGQYFCLITNSKKSAVAAQSLRVMFGA